MSPFIQWQKAFTCYSFRFNCHFEIKKERKEEGQSQCHSVCSPTTLWQGGIHYQRLHIDHVNPSSWAQEDLKLSLMVAAAWGDVSQLLAEGAEVAKSKVSSRIFQCVNKCCLMTLFMCANVVLLSANNHPWLGTSQGGGGHNSLEEKWSC